MTIIDFEKLIDEHGKEIYGFIRKLVGQQSDADDLYQQTFLAAFERLESIDQTQNPKAFLISISVGLYRNQYRKNRRRETIAPSFAITEENADYLPSDENLENNYLKQEEKQLVRKCLDRLDERFRIPLLLYYQAELNIEQIAKVMKKPSGTVKTRLKKARELMKKELEDQGYER